MPIPTGSLRGLAQPFVESMARKGWTATRISAALKADGLSYRRTDFLRDVRSYKGAEAARLPLRSVRHDFKPPEQFIQETDLNLSRRYRIVFEVERRDPATGRIEKGFASLSTSHLRNLGSLLDQMQQVIEDPEGPSDQVTTSVKVDSIMQRRGTGRPEIEDSAPWD